MDLFQQLRETFPELKLNQLEPIPGNDGHLAALEHVSTLEECVRGNTRLVLFDGVTGCGKSKVIPPKLWQILCSTKHITNFSGSLLVLTTSAKDVPDACSYCERFRIKSHWRTGGVLKVETASFRTPMSCSQQLDWQVGGTVREELIGFSSMVLLSSMSLGL